MRGEHPPTHEMEPSSFISLEHWIEHDFRRQYETQVKTMARTGLLELLPDAGEMGIIGIDGKEYPVPSMEAIVEDLMKTPERKAMVEKKMKQGFTEIDLTPMASPIARLKILAENVIRKHHAEGKLFATRKNPADENEPLVALELDTNQPLFVWDKAEHGDVNGEIKYFPKQFDKNDHGGVTKPEWLAESASSPFPGWDVSLQESTINIPRQGKGKTIGGRKQLETNKSPIEYLKTLLTDPAYHGESGTTLEQWLTKFVKTLDTTNQVIDDYQGNGSLNYLIAQYHVASDRVLFGYWYRDVRRASVGRFDPGRGYGDFGVRPAVRFSELEV